MKRITFLFAVLLLLASCADSKTFKIEEQIIHAAPYGWADFEEMKNPNVVYKVNTGNVIWSILAFETGIVPIWLTGWQIYEPVRLKACAPNCK